MLGLAEKHRTYNKTDFKRPEDVSNRKKSGVVVPPDLQTIARKRGDGAFTSGRKLVKRVRKMCAMLSRSNKKAAELTLIQQENQVCARPAGIALPSCCCCCACLYVLSELYLYLSCCNCLMDTG